MLNNYEVLDGFDLSTLSKHPWQCQILSLRIIMYGQHPLSKYFAVFKIVWHRDSDAKSGMYNEERQSRAGNTCQGRTVFEIEIAQTEITEIVPTRCLRLYLAGRHLVGGIFIPQPYNQLFFVIILYKRFTWFISLESIMYIYTTRRERTIINSKNIFYTNILILYFLLILINCISSEFHKYIFL